MKQVHKCPESTRLWPWVLGSGLLILGLWSGCWLFAGFYFEELQQRGQFGDMFGAVNALFAGLAFAGVIGAIILQRNELKLQREELKLTRNEMRGQNEQLMAQDLTLKRQNFESSFFQLLSFHNGIVESFQINRSHGSVNGRRCFGTFLAELRNLNETMPDNDISNVWREFYGKYQSTVGHYFRHLYNTVKFVDRHVFLQEFEDRESYTNLIRAQLSSHEMGILFYNCLSPKGAKFKRLAEKYSLFEHMDKGVLLNEEHVNLYKSTAFGQSDGG